MKRVWCGISTVRRQQQDSVGWSTRICSRMQHMPALKCVFASLFILFYHVRQGSADHLEITIIARKLPCCVYGTDRHKLVAHSLHPHHHMHIERGSRVGGGFGGRTLSISRGAPELRKMFPPQPFAVRNSTPLLARAVGPFGVTSGQGWYGTNSAERAEHNISWRCTSACSSSGSCRVDGGLGICCVFICMFQCRDMRRAKYQPADERTNPLRSCSMYASRAGIIKVTPRKMCSPFTTTVLRICWAWYCIHSFNKAR